MSINMKFSTMIVVACLILRFIMKLCFPQNWLIYAVIAFKAKDLKLYESIGL